MLTADDLMGRVMHDRLGLVAGRITAVYRYPSSLAAPWGAAAVTSGRLMFKSTHLVDLREAVAHDDHVTASYELSTIKGAPGFEAMIGDTLSEQDAAAVLDHYQINQ